MKKGEREVHIKEGKKLFIVVLFSSCKTFKCHTYSMIERAGRCSRKLESEVYCKSKGGYSTTREKKI